MSNNFVMLFDITISLCEDKCMEKQTFFINFHHGELV